MVSHESYKDSSQFEFVYTVERYHWLCNHEFLQGSKASNLMAAANLLAFWVCCIWPGIRWRFDPWSSGSVNIFVAFHSIIGEMPCSKSPRVDLSDSLKRLTNGCWTSIDLWRWTSQFHKGSLRLLRSPEVSTCFCETAAERVALEVKTFEMVSTFAIKAET